MAVDRQLTLFVTVLAMAIAPGKARPGSAKDAREGTRAADDAETAPTRRLEPPAPSARRCTLTLPADILADRRAACAFVAGQRASETLGIPAELSHRIPIRHIVVLMRENRAFDHLLGQLHAQGQPETEPIPSSFVNRDRHGKKVAPRRADTTCLRPDPPHQWQAMHETVNGGAMDGFVKVAAEATHTDGHYVMSYYERDDLPFYYWLASTWALNDRHFASVRSGTFPNRDFLLFGTNDGVKQTREDTIPDPDTPSLMQALDHAGVSWGAYSDGLCFSGATGWKRAHPGCRSLADFLARLDSGKLPAVAFVDGVGEVDDDHPPADLQKGERWLREIYRRAVASPAWPKLALIWTYDEAGGFADHVPPPNRACIARPVIEDAAYYELGPRVPLVLISPYARGGFVSHVVEEHTAITRFIETIFDLPALTARDANSPALLDLFDFCAPSMLHPPPAPAAGVGGCAEGAGE